MASRLNKKRRRQNLMDRIGDCEAADCPMDAAREVFIPDDGRKHKLCNQHALAVEFQMRRNKGAKATELREKTEEKLGLR